MPILGNLSEFPLPEVLLLIGSRTGRLRLLDVPEFGIMDIDFANGEVQSMYIGRQTLTESSDMISKMSAVVQSQCGMFEFKIHRVDSVRRDKPLMVNQLVLSLVCYVDEQIARQHALESPHQWYVLEFPQPDIWIEPELNGFFARSRSYLTTGVHCDHLAQCLAMEISEVHQNLTNLRLLGLIKLVDGASTVSLTEVDIQEKISRKSNDFLRASRAASEMKKLTTNLSSINPPGWVASA